MHEYLFKPARVLSVSGEAIPLQDGQPALVPVRLTGKESVNKLFAYQLELAAPEAGNLWAPGGNNFVLDEFVGKTLTVSIELDEPGSFEQGVWQPPRARDRRHINAIVAEAGWAGSHGRQVRYLLTLAPWLYLATLRRNCRIFQNKSVVQVLAEVLGGLPYPTEMRLYGHFPPRDHITQFNESDFALICRLCAEWGITFFFEHEADRHVLVLVNSTVAFNSPESVAFQTLVFGTPGRRTHEEHVESFHPVSRLTAGRFTTNDYDYTESQADMTTSSHDPRPTANANEEVYDFHEDVNFAQPKAGANQQPHDWRQEARSLAQMRMESLRSAGRRAEGFGHLRGIATGKLFELVRHPHSAANDVYAVLSTELDMREVPEESLSAGQSRGFTVDLRFEAHPRSEPLRPERLTPRPAMKVQTARVVGPAGCDIWTDSLGRIKVQMHWDRQSTRDENASCWVRVAEAWAGGNLGSQFLPRIGQEVLIAYIDGDVDQPICFTRVRNQFNTPPLILPNNQAVSLIRSRELKPGAGNSPTGRSNQLAFDDTAGHIQAQLRSDHLHSQLALGDITRIQGHEGRTDSRGEGFELRTDGHGVVRAKAGLLVTTEARDGACGAMKDMVETLGRLATARDEHLALAHAARTAEGDWVRAGQSEVTDALSAQQAQACGHGEKFPELSAPLLVLASPAGIATSTAGSTHLESREHTAISTGGHFSVSSMGSWFGSVRDRIVFFAQRLGIALTAAKGPIRVEAQSDQLELVAQRVLSLMSTQDWVRITAKKGVLINGGGSYIRLDENGIETGTLGSWVLHAASSNVTGPKNLDTASRSWSDSPFDDGYVVQHPRTGETLANIRYQLVHQDGSVVEGVTDGQGRIPRQRNVDPTTLTIRLLGLAD